VLAHEADHILFVDRAKSLHTTRIPRRHRRVQEIPAPLANSPGAAGVPLRDRVFKNSTVRVDPGFARAQVAAVCRSDRP
jgi:hypothetical protein